MPVTRRWAARAGRRRRPPAAGVPALRLPCRARRLRFLIRLPHDWPCRTRRPGGCASGRRRPSEHSSLPQTLSRGQVPSRCASRMMSSRPSRPSATRPRGPASSWTRPSASTASRSRAVRIAVSSGRRSPAVGAAPPPFLDQQRAEALPELAGRPELLGAGGGLRSQQPGQAQPRGRRARARPAGRSPGRPLTVFTNDCTSSSGSGAGFGSSSGTQAGSVIPPGYLRA